MAFLLPSKTRYVSLKDSDLPEYTEEINPGSKSFRQRMQFSWVWLSLALLTCVSMTVTTTLLISNAVHSHIHESRMACLQPPIRREWRTLDRATQTSYINAVKCLALQPSKLLANGTRYDDFPWVHQKTAKSAHQSAPFLPWHRFYIHSYETALKQQCAYEGVLPYWDWSQDYEDFENAPVWDSDYGFGGNGAVNSEETVGDGRCVQDGPFAGTSAMFYGDQERPHCLSRGFSQGEALRELTDLVNPKDLEELLERPDYSVFAPELERRAHTFISRSIGGDFSKYTGPYDPVFFLHHTNLDRLWSIWQHKHIPTAYSGRLNMTSSESASTKDVLDIGGLLSSVPVSEVMSTTSGIFCYQY